MFSSRRKNLLMVTLLAFTCFLDPPAPAASGSAKGWVLHYWSENVGNFTIKACAQGVLIDLPGLDICIASKPGSWRVFTYNLSSRRVHEGSLPEFCRRYPPFKLKHYPGMKAHEADFKTIKASYLTFRKRKKYTELVGDLGVDKEANRLQTEEFEYVYTDNFHLPAQEYRMIRGLCAGPDYPELFIEKSILFVGGKRRVRMTLKKFEQAALPLSTFEPPPGLEKVDDPRLVSQRRTEALEEVVKDMGVGERFGDLRHGK